MNWWKALAWRKTYVKINLDEKEMKELEEIYWNVVKEWNEFKEEVKNKKEDNLVELYPYKIAWDTDDNIKR